MSILYVLLTALHLFVCFVLIVVVLLQAGKGGGMSGLFGGGGDSVFGGQGPTKPLAVLTAICAGLFMITCISLTIMTRSSGVRSVIQTGPAQQQMPAGAPRTTTPTNAPAKPASPAPAPSAPASQPTNSK